MQALDGPAKRFIRFERALYGRGSCGRAELIEKNLRADVCGQGNESLNDKSPLVDTADHRPVVSHTGWDDLQTRRRRLREHVFVDLNIGDRRQVRDDAVANGREIQNATIRT